MILRDMTLEDIVQLKDTLLYKISGQRIIPVYISRVQATFSDRHSIEFRLESLDGSGVDTYEITDAQPDKFVPELFESFEEANIKFAEFLKDLIVKMGTESQKINDKMQEEKRNLRLKHLKNEYNNLLKIYPECGV